LLIKSPVYYYKNYTETISGSDGINKNGNY
jgi:hypothetical protein